MDAIPQHAMNIANDAWRQNRQVALLPALKRIDGGNYGNCHQCDDFVGAGRLAIDPTAMLCVLCA